MTCFRVTGCRDGKPGEPSILTPSILTILGRHILSYLRHTINTVGPEEVFKASSRKTTTRAFHHFFKQKLIID